MRLVAWGTGWGNRVERLEEGGTILSTSFGVALAFGSVLILHTCKK